MKISEQWIERLFGLSLALLGLSSLLLSVSGLAEIALPVWAVRLLGIVNLAALPMTVYSVVRSFREKQAMRKTPQRQGRPGKKKKGKKK